MIGLYGLKGWFGRVLEPVLNFAQKARLSPDVFTLIGVLGGVLAGVGVMSLQWWLALVGGIVRLAGANLDGALARRRGKATRGGAFKNELGDRLADFATMLSFALVPAVAADSQLLALCLFAAGAAMLPSIASWIGLARGMARINGGPLGKTERTFAAVLIVAAIELGAPASITIELGMLLIIIGSTITALLRIRSTNA
jgi:CDP-diacylglycerol--glycerol-3-phosphate 3-phosphatidyltransferase